jgi:fibronectin-binding autotransporter adhesin
MARAFGRLANSVALVLSIAQVTSAQLDDHLWIGGAGNQLWQLDDNWNIAPFPNDPGRVDTNEMLISNVEGANLSVSLPANLNVDIGATNVTVAALAIGGTSGPVTTNITTSGGRLVFENYERNNDTDPDNVVCAFNCGSALLTSAGAPGATNIITAVVGVNDDLEIVGNNNLTLAGGLAEMPGPDGDGFVGVRALTPGRTVLVPGPITTLEIPVMVGGTLADIALAVNDGTKSQGTVDVSGVIGGPGRMQFGTDDAQSSIALPLGTVILRGTNTYTGRTILGRGNVILANDRALGTGDVKHEDASQDPLQVGYNLISNSNSRIIDNKMIIGQWQTVKGENSLEWSGIAYQDANRGWINLLPPGRVLTLSGGQFPNHTEVPPPLPGRELTFDGTGRTNVTGGLHDEWSSDTQSIDPGNFVGSFRFRGTGSVYVSGGASTYRGDTIVEGANVHFATDADLGNSFQIVSTGGAIGVDTGLIGSALLTMIDDADSGGLMLGTTEYGIDLDFTTGDLANAANMSLAPHEGGSIYTGTITPAAGTYRLGGGSGTLTLPNDNQLTGANNLVAVNGGVVDLAGSNNYTGTTSLIARYQTSLLEAAERDTIAYEDGDEIPNDQRYVSTTIQVNSLVDGGLPSSIGSSTSEAENLYIQGSTLRYVGGATSSNRLFTIGTGGAAIDASGTGALVLTNMAALGVDIATGSPGPERPLTLTGASAADNTLAALIPNAANGGEVGLTKSGTGKWIVTGNNTYTGDTRVEAGTLSITKAYLADTSDVRMTTGGILDLNFPGTDVVNSLFFNDLGQAAGTWGAIGNPAATFQSEFFTGPGLLRVSVLAETGIRGDYNNNGIVDAPDFVLWRNSSGTTVALPNDDIGGTIGAAHYNQWRANFGATVGAGASLAQTSLPEPAAVMPGALAASVLLCFVRRLRASR